MYRGWIQTDYQNKHYNINQKWLQHVQRMDTNRLPKQALQYKPKGRRNIGRPRKRWRDQLHLEDQGTGKRLTLQGHDDDYDDELGLTAIIFIHSARTA